MSSRVVEYLELFQLNQLAIRITSDDQLQLLDRDLQEASREHVISEYHMAMLQATLKERPEIYIRIPNNFLWLWAKNRSDLREAYPGIRIVRFEEVFESSEEVFETYEPCCKFEGHPLFCKCNPT